MKTYTEKEMDNAYDKGFKDGSEQLIEALNEVQKAEGAYSEDRLEHAENTIKNMVEIAEEAINTNKNK